MLTKARDNNSSISDFVGVFTNRKPLLEALLQVGLVGCYISGSRKQKSVNSNTLGTGFVDGKLIIYRQNEESQQEVVAYRIKEIYKNTINSLLKRNQINE